MTWSCSSPAAWSTCSNGSAAAGSSPSPNVSLLKASPALDDELEDAELSAPAVCPSAAPAVGVAAAAVAVLLLLLLATGPVLYLAKSEPKAALDPLAVRLPKALNPPTLPVVVEMVEVEAAGLVDVVVDEDEDEDDGDGEDEDASAAEVVAAEPSAEAEPDAAPVRIEDIFPKGFANEELEEENVLVLLAGDDVAVVLLLEEVEEEEEDDGDEEEDEGVDDIVVVDDGV